MVWEIAAIAVLGALLSLDTTAAFQFMISQPLIACTIVGGVMGNLLLGLEIGFLLQLLWISYLPVGAVLFPEGNVGSMVAAITAIQLQHLHEAFPHMIVLFSVLVALGVSYIGLKAVQLIRTWNISVLNQTFRRLQRGNVAAIRNANVRVLVVHTVVMFILIFVMTLLSIYLLENVLVLIPNSWDQTARFVGIGILGVGIGLTATLYRERKDYFYFAGGAAAGIGLLLII